MCSDALINSKGRITAWHVLILKNDVKKDVMIVQHVAAEHSDCMLLFILFLHQNKETGQAQIH